MSSKVAIEGMQDVRKISLFKAAKPSSSGLRLALIADTHGFVDPRVAESVGDCDAVVHAGDIGDQQVLKTLRVRRRRVLVVRGNNDVAAKWHVAERPALDRLPQEIEIALPGGTLVAVHGHQVLPASARHQRLRQRYENARLVVYGHTHRMLYDREALPWVINPGAAGRVRTFGGPSCAILEVSERRWRVRLLRFSAPRE